MCNLQEDASAKIVTKPPNHVRVPKRDTSINPINPHVLRALRSWQLAEDQKLRRHATWWDLDNVTSFFRSLGHHVGTLDTNKKHQIRQGAEANPGMVPVSEL